ncbi:unnamed protein product, partial [Didymodactylos carnosus]
MSQWKLMLRKKHSDEVCHTQMTVRKELEETTHQLNNIQSLKASNLFSVENEKSMKLLEKQQSVCQNELKRPEQEQLSQAKFRQRRKLKMKRLIEKHPDLATDYDLALHEKVNKPVCYVNVIVEIANCGATADPNRRSNLISPCMPLLELSPRLKDRGFNLSRSVTYWRLLPRRYTSAGGKRHVQTVRVRLIKANNDEHNKHINPYFTTNTLNHLKALSMRLVSLTRRTTWKKEEDPALRLPC